MPTFTDLANARFADQRQVMEENEAAGECPFCWENLHKYHLEPIWKQGEHWLVTANHWPYNHTKHHYLFIYRDHIENPEGMSAAGAHELITLTNQLIKEFAIPGGGLFMRFGDTRYSAGSVKHLHAQLVVPDILAPDFEPVRVKIGTKGPHEN